MRVAWSMLVGVLGAAACAAALLTSGSSARVAPGPVAASGGVRHLQEVARRVETRQTSDGAAVPGVSEEDLRAFETATLGPQHAADHAADRAAEREHPAAMAREYREVRAATPPSPGPASEVGRWETGFSIPTFAIHTILLPTGEVLWFAYERFADGGDADRNTTRAFLWNPTTGQSTRVDPPVNPKTGKPYNIWCSGHTLTEDGRVVVFGGNLASETVDHDYEGLNKVFTFDPWTRKWVGQPDMRHGRWYPSGVRLPDGTIPILSGLDEFGKGDMNNQVELFTPSAAMDGVGNVDLLGTTRPADKPNDQSMPPTGQYYPHLFSMASGRMLEAGPDNSLDTWFMDSHTNSSFTWKKAGDASTDRLWGNAVPLASDDTGPHQVMALGGVDDIVNNVSKPLTSTEIFDEDANAAPGAPTRGQWAPGAPLNVGRAHANAVLLPDGSVAEVGGGVGSDPSEPDGTKYASTEEQKQVELWNPGTRKWKLGPAQREPRAYHSTALLLPDGRVISAGDDRGAKQKTGDIAEIYEPPYLHQGGTRPVISFAPPAAQLGSTFGVDTSSADIQKAALVAPGSVTHAVDMNQRYVPLSVKQSGNGCVDLKAPPTANAAPPGYYMLFLLDSRGVPSVAQFVQVKSGATLTQTCTQRHPPATDPGGHPQPPTTPSNPGPAPATPPPAPLSSSGSPASPPAPRALTVRLPGASTLKVLRKGLVRVRCRAGGTARRSCAVRVLRPRRGSRTTTLGGGTGTIPAGRADTVVTLRLNAAGRRLMAGLRPGGGMKVRLDGRVTERGSGRRGSLERLYWLVR